MVMLQTRSTNCRRILIELRSILSETELHGYSFVAAIGRGKGTSTFVEVIRLTNR